MTKYYNERTRAIVDSPFVLSGKDWIKYEGLDKDEVIEDKEEKEEVEDENLKNITKKQIEQELQAMGIEYDPKAKKADLYKLMMEA